MSWQGEFAFAPTALVFRGRSAENRLHAHAAVQCVFSPAGIELHDTTGNEFRGPAWIIRSGIPHQLAPAERLVPILLEPQSPLAQALIAATAVGYGPSQLFVLPAEAAALASPIWVSSPVRVHPLLGRQQASGIRA